MKIITHSRVSMTFTLYLIITTFLSCIFTYTTKAASIDIVEGDEWSFVIGKKEPPFKWNHIGFDKQDKDWIKGRTGIGYSHQRVRTQLNDMRNNYRSVYARRDLTFSKDAYEFLQQDSVSIKASIVCDGYFQVWLNGIEVIRSHNERGALGAEDQQASEINIPDFAQEMV